VREADDRADRDVRAVQDPLGPPHVDRPHADARDVVLRGQPAAVVDERVIELRPKQRVVDRLGDVALGELREIEGHAWPT
jgi:hypothetical protein